MSKCRREADRPARENEALRRQIAASEADARRFKTTLCGVGDAVICAAADGNVRQQSVAFFRTIVESIPQGLFVKDRSSVYLAVNEPYATSLGLEPEQLVGRDDFAFFPTELAEEHRADDRAVMESGRVKDIEERVIARGKESWVHTTRAPVRDDTGQVTAVLGLIEDIAERKRAEHALEASEMQYRRLFEAARDGILILEADTGRIVDVNPFLMELTGYSLEEFLGKHLWEIGPIKDVAASRISFADLQANNYVRYEDLPLEGRDGQSIHVEFVSNVYRVDDHNVIQCNIRDITLRKQTEKRNGEELQRWHDVMLSREDRVQELKREVNELCPPAGEPARYPIQE